MSDDKATLQTEVNRYMTLLSQLKQPPLKYLESLGYFKGLILSANRDELTELQQTWESLQPNDPEILEYIKTGVA